MTEHMHQIGTMMLLMWVPLILALVLLLAAALFLMRQSKPGSLLAADLAGKFGTLEIRAPAIKHEHASNSTEAVLHDTLFILPDISNYTRFMTGSHFSFSHAQEIIFSLINAMIDAATPAIHLSKLEGDAALFYADAEKLDPEFASKIVLDIFAAFFGERRRLIESNLCPCKACKHIADLDLKIFVHRGKASRFEFRGSVDHFGTDVIILHRLMKNRTSGHRYIMVTQEAQNLMKLPATLSPVDVEEVADEIGPLRAQVYELSDEMIVELEQRQPLPSPSRTKETLKKLRSSFNLLFDALRANFSHS